MHAQAWPRKRPGKPTPGQRYQREEFAIAASWASDPEPKALQSAKNLAIGSDNVSRDLLMMASYGTLYDVYKPDGTLATSYRMVAPNAQLILEQITSVPGSIIFRSPDWWLGLPPANENYVLTMRGGMPIWLPAQSATPGAAIFTWLTTPGTYTYAVPDGVNTLRCALIGGGGGGGSGRQTQSGTAASGGAGGGGGALSMFDVGVTAIVGDLSITVGAGGTGGPTQPSPSSNGTGGSNGGDSTITYSGQVVQARGGNGGGPGGTAISVGGSGGNHGTNVGQTGGGCNTGGAGTAPTAATLPTGLGGGGGGGVPAIPITRVGGAGGGYTINSGLPQNAAAGGVFSPLQAAGDGIVLQLQNLASTGGGGGYSSVASAGGSGGNGALWGGGGGGGGATSNGFGSGKGGDGASGAVLIIAW